MEELIAIQSELKVNKNRYNTFGKFNYRSCEDILDALKPLLSKYSCFIKLEEEIIEIGGKIFVKSVAEIYTVTAKEKQSVKSYAQIPESKSGMDASQVTGSAISYARKYALCGLFAIDDGHDNDLIEQTKTKPILTITMHKQIANCIKGLNNGMTIEGIKEHYEITPEIEKFLLSKVEI